MTQPATAFSLSEIGQIGLAIQDVARSVEFYRDKLGVRLLFQMPGMAFFDCNGIRLMLSLPQGGRPGERFVSLVYFKVPDIQSAFATLSGRGVVFEQQPHLVARMADHDLWMASFRDPDENALHLMSEVRPPSR